MVLPKQFVLANLSPLSQNDRLKAWLSRFKGQLISERLFGVFNFPQCSALESKKWSNQKGKAHYYVK